MIPGIYGGEFLSSRYFPQMTSVITNTRTWYIFCLISKLLRGGGANRKFFAIFFHLKLERGSVLPIPYSAAANINVCLFPRC